jgi:hypothetical protein
MKLSHKRVKKKEEKKEHRNNNKGVIPKAIFPLVNRLSAFGTQAAASSQGAFSCK